MEPTTGVLPHPPAEQHTHRLHQSNPLHPPALAHQAEAALEAHLSLHQRQALGAIQDLEHQRLQMWSQDSEANPHR